MKKLILATICTTAIALTGCGEEKKATESVNKSNQAQTENVSVGSLEVGKHYSVLPSKLEVGIEKPHMIEFFWLGCPHCQDFEPTMVEWKKKFAGKAEFKRIAAVTPNWRRDAQVYFTLEEMGDVEKTFPETIAFYEYTRKNTGKLPTMEEIHTHMTNIGVNLDKFKETFDSDAVAKRMEEGQKLFKQAQLGGVPAFIINGTHNIELRGLKTHGDVITTSRTLLNNTEPKMN